MDNNKEFTTVYSWEQIEAHIRSMGSLRFFGDHLNNQLQASDSVKSMITNFFELTWNFDGGVHRGRVNDKGTVEGQWARASITDIYRIVLHKFPDTTIKELYETIFVPMIRTYTFVCPDIHKRVYCKTTSSLPSLFTQGNEDTDEYGVKIVRLYSSVQENSFSNVYIHTEEKYSAQMTPIVAAAVPEPVLSI